MADGIKYEIGVITDPQGRPLKDVNGRMKFRSFIDPQSHKTFYQARMVSGPNAGTIGNVEMSWIKKNIKHIVNANMSTNGQVYPVLSEYDKVLAQQQKDAQARARQELEEQRKKQQERNQQIKEQQKREAGQRKEAQQNSSQQNLSQQKSQEQSTPSSKEVESKRYRELKVVWGNDVDSEVNKVLNTLTTLYSSCYSLVKPYGILTSKGVGYTSSDGMKRQIPGEDGKYVITHSDIRSDRLLYIDLYEKINSACNNQFRHFVKTGTDWNAEMLLNASSTATITDFHLQAMFGHIKPWVGNHSIRPYLTANHIENNGSSIEKWNTMRGFLGSEIKKTLYKAYILKNLSTEMDSNQIALFKSINSKICSYFKLVIAVIESKPNVNTKLRIGSAILLDTKKLQTTLDTSLNSDNSNFAKVEEIKNLGNGVYEVNIIYDEKSYSEDSLYAYQVLDILKDKEIRPSWSNVILGKSLDGNILTHNFADLNNSTVAMYGSKGSGKGVMTLNLISSALADGCYVFYFDGKPDTGISLANAAWSRGTDACVFNGKEVRGSPLEMPGVTLRDPNLRFMSKNYIPKEIFSTEEELEEFILLTTYYRGLDLVLRVSESRMAQGNQSNWLVVIFDEVQQMAAIESKVISTLEDAKKKRQHAKVEVTDEKGKTKIQGINYLKDETWNFIDAYMNWRKIMAGKLRVAIGSTFRKAFITVFYIWQTTSFPDSFASSSIIASAIKQEGGPIVKIVGRAAAENRGSSVFGTPNSLKPSKWYDDKFSGSVGGYWAIGNNVNGDMKVFRPFNVYSDANNKDLILTNAATRGLSEQDLIGVSLNEDGSVKSELGFDGYASLLLSQNNLSLGTQLSLGYQYADSFVKSEGLASNLLTFMYNAHSFGSQTANTNDFSEDSIGDIHGVNNDSVNRGMGDTGDLDDWGDLGDWCGINQNTPQGSARSTTQTTTKQSNPTYNAPQNTVNTNQHLNNTQFTVSPPISNTLPKNVNPKNTYISQVSITENPFITYPTDSNKDILLTTKEITQVLMQDIQNVFGSPDMIQSFGVSAAGVLIINGTFYIPRFEDEFLYALPSALREKVMSGQVVDLFDLHKVYRYKYLTQFSLYDVNLAQGRARKEMGIGFKKRWSILFKKFRYLQKIEIGDRIVYTRQSPDDTQEESLLQKFESNIQSTYSNPATRNRLDQVWDSKPVRAITGALGWTAGVRIAFGIATLMGPWGLLFGTIAAAGAINQVRNDPNSMFYNGRGGHREPPRRLPPPQCHPRRR